jgi:hypothetical protein
MVDGIVSEDGDIESSWTISESMDIELRWCGIDSSLLVYSGA